MYELLCTSDGAGVLYQIISELHNTAKEWEDKARETEKAYFDMEEQRDLWMREAERFQREYYTKGYKGAMNEVIGLIQARIQD